jgi:hypothetical protein
MDPDWEDRCGVRRWDDGGDLNRWMHKTYRHTVGGKLNNGWTYRVASVSHWLIGQATPPYALEFRITYLLYKIVQLQFGEFENKVFGP